MVSKQFRLAFNAVGLLFIIAHIAAVLFLAAAQASADDGSACYSIVSSDHRAFCLAKARKDPSMCYAIVDAAMRSECLVEVRREASH